MDVIMARGNTAKLLKSAKLGVPVVTIPITDFELIRSIESAKKLYGTDDSQIGYIGLEDVINTVRGFLEMLHCHVRLYPVSSSQDIRSQVKQAKEDHVDVIIGGVYTQMLAQAEGLNCVLLESSLSSIREAYDRALEVCRSFNQQKKKLQERLTILNAVSDGIISIDEKGTVTSFNPAAESCLMVSESAALKTSYTDLFARDEQMLIHQALLSERQTSGHFLALHGTDYSMDIHPILVKGKNRGIILTLRRYAPFLSRSLKPPGLQSSRTGPCAFTELVGESAVFRIPVVQAQEYAVLEEPVLLSGETGTGNLCQLENLCRRLVIQNPKDQVLTLDNIVPAISPAAPVFPDIPAPAPDSFGANVISPSVSVPSPGVFIHGHLVTHQELMAMNSAYHGKKNTDRPKTGDQPFYTLEIL